MPAALSKKRIEFGDFQTPLQLAQDICSLLSRRGTRPASVLEPNCGTGAFVLACLERFPAAKQVIAADINAEYVSSLQSLLERHPSTPAAKVFCGDFYDSDWPRLVQELEDPVLVIGNPPWVTNAGLGAIGGSNLPQKCNFQNHRGFDAITGKSNFDVSEWMLIREMEWLDGRRGTLAMLCKIAVARKVLLHAWKRAMQIARSDIFLIDAAEHFGAAVDACLLVADFSPCVRTTQCAVHRSLQDDTPSRVFGLYDSRLVSDVSAYERWKFLAGQGERKWRSGIKHDCAEIMELHNMGGGFYMNGLGQHVKLEPKYLYPMLKSSQLVNWGPIPSDRWMLVPQQFIGEDTRAIKDSAPRTWEYLQAHDRRLKQRASSIYKGRPKFSVFGVGEYSFAPWKIAISALYKKLDFKVVPPVDGKPVVFDDTCYFLACQSREEAKCLAQLLNSAPAREFYNSLIFWDAKRPITAEILRQLNLGAVAREVGLEQAVTP